MDIKRPILVVICTLFFSLTLFTGVLLQSQQLNPEIAELGRDFSYILNVIDQNYVEKVDRKELFLKAANEIASRDQYSGFLLERSITQIEESIDGNYVGIGIEINRKSDHLVVTDIHPFSAASGKLKFDDRIYFLDKQAVEELDNTKLYELLRGPVGSTITLGLKRGEDETLIEIPLTRKMTIKKPIRFVQMLDEKNKIGYMYIDIFNNNLAQSFSLEYLQLLKSSGGMKAFILDLRGNPGGGIESAVAFCDLFLKAGVIVATIGNEEGIRGKEVLYMAKEGNELPLVPILIMLDRESASAAELSSSCLRDHKIAKIFGEKSYGKGETQTTIPMTSKVIGDYGLKLTTSKFYSKSGFEANPKVSISGIGITPDFSFDFGFQDTMLTRYKNFRRAWGLWNQELAEGKPLEEVKSKNFYFMDLEKYDPGLKKAVEILSSEEGFKW